MKACGILPQAFFIQVIYSHLQDGILPTHSQIITGISNCMNKNSYSASVNL